MQLTLNAYISLTHALTHTIAMRKALTLCLDLFERNVRSLSQEVFCECVAPFKWHCWSCWHCPLLAHCQGEATKLSPYMSVSFLFPHYLQPLKPAGNLNSEGHRTLYLGIRVLNIPAFRAISRISHLLGVKNRFLWLTHKLQNTVLGEMHSDCKQLT